MKNTFYLLLIIVIAFQSCKKDEVAHITNTIIVKDTVLVKDTSTTKATSGKFDLQFEAEYGLEDIIFTLKIPGLNFKPKPTFIINNDTIAEDWEIDGDTILLNRATTKFAKIVNFSINYYNKTTTGTFVFPEIKNLKINDSIAVKLTPGPQQLISKESSYTLTFDVENQTKLIIINKDVEEVESKTVLTKNSYTFLEKDIVSNNLFVNLYAYKNAENVNVIGNFADGKVSGFYKLASPKSIVIKQ